jgi:hypothetical protein
MKHRHFYAFLRSLCRRHSLQHPLIEFKIFQTIIDFFVYNELYSYCNVQCNSEYNSVVLELIGNDKEKTWLNIQKRKKARQRHRKRLPQKNRMGTILLQISPKNLIVTTSQKETMEFGIGWIRF